MTGLSYLFGFMLGGMGAFFLGYRRLYEILAIMLFIAAGVSFILPETKKTHENKISFDEELSVITKTLFNDNLAVPYISIFTLSFNQGIIVSIYAILLGLMGYTTAQIGMFFSIMVIVSILIHYPSGLLGDKLGKEKIITIGLILQAVSFVVFQTSLSLPTIILGMLINGLGHGLIYPNGGGLIRDHTSMENRGIATGIFYALLVAGVAVGAPMSSIVADAMGYSYGLTLGIIAPAFTLTIILAILVSSSKS